MKKGILSLLTLIFAAGPPLWAGTVYVPHAANRIIRGTDYDTQIRFHNDSGSGQTVTYLFIADRADGTLIDREVEPITMTVPPRVTTRVDDIVPEGARGIVEILIPNEVSVSARLIGTTADESTTYGIELPVVNSRNAVSPGRTATLTGLNRNSGRVISDLFLFNLSLNRAFCSVQVRRRGGALEIDQNLSIQPLSVTPFGDVLGILGIDNGGEMAIVVSCDQITYPFATSQLLDTGEMLFLKSGSDGRSTLNPFPANLCPDDAFFRTDGIFHTPTGRGEALRRTFVIPTTPGETFSRLVVSMEFTMGPWFQVESRNHSIFWLQRTDIWPTNVFGYLNAFGPNKNFIKNTHNVDLARGQILTAQDGAVLQEGETYAVIYTYDAAANFIEAVVSVKGGEEIARIEDFPTVRQIVTKSNFKIAFGHTDNEAGPEVPTKGWDYANLCIRLE